MTPLSLTPKPTAKCTSTISPFFTCFANTVCRYRKDPKWVRLILIRRVENIAEVGLEEKNDASRFEKAFKDVPDNVWHVFRDAEECYKLIDEAFGAEGKDGRA